jgi:hypothetical protein
MESDDFDELTENSPMPVKGVRQMSMDEYKLLQYHLGLYRTSAMSIKNWSVTVSLTSIGAAFSQHEPTLLIIASFAAVIFWIMDARWLLYGESFNSRAKSIEMHALDNNIPYIGPQIEMACISYRDLIRSRPYTLAFMRRPSVYMPHSIIFLVSLILYTLAYLKILKV